jgi:hypothetical protein
MERITGCGVSARVFEATTFTRASIEWDATCSHPNSSTGKAISGSSATAAGGVGSVIASGGRTIVKWGWR